MLDRFEPGCLVLVVGREFPPRSGNVKAWLGLFEEPGYPKTLVNKEEFNALPLPEKMRILKQRCCGKVYNGTLCLVLATQQDNDDHQWYYYVQPVGSGIIGWTRSTARLELVEPTSCW